jgi:hypothetical protein
MTNSHNLMKTMTHKQRPGRAFSLVILLALPFIAGVANAAPKHTAESDANDAVRRGVELLAKKDYAGALAAFREAREVAPNAMTAAQIAFVHIGMGHWLEANSDLEEVLADARDPWVAAHQAQLNESLEMVRKHVGSLRVRGTPEGAQVKFRGEVMGLLPMRSPVRVVVGRGDVVVQMPGYRISQVAVEINPQQTSDIVVALASQTPAVSEPAKRLQPEPPVTPRAGVTPEKATTPRSPASNDDAFAAHLRHVHTYRWVGFLAGTVLLGAGIPSYFWLKKDPKDREPLTTKENAAVIATAAGLSLGTTAMVFGIMSSIYIGLYEPASPARVSFRTPTLQIGGHF